MANLGKDMGGPVYLRWKLDKRQRLMMVERVLKLTTVFEDRYVIVQFYKRAIVGFSAPLFMPRKNAVASWTS